MHTRAAILWDVQTDWSVESIELDGPQRGEVLVSWTASGLCHSDHHPRTGDTPIPLPVVGGHEGAGVVQEVGPEVHDFAPGDHVVASFVPSCGRCRWCATGYQNLCDYGALIGFGTMIDGTARRHARGRDVNAMSCLGTFSPYATVDATSLVKVDDDVPLDRACLIGCGITTGWGSAVHTADVAPGDIVIVIGFGGVGSGAVQGARIAGAELIVVVEPVEWKRDKAFEVGATHVVTTAAEATALVAELTRGVMADSAILTLGELRSHHVGEALDLIRKGGAVVVTSVAPFAISEARIPLGLFTLFQKRLLGSLFGQSNPRADIPRLLRLYRSGQLKLDEIVTTEYKLDDVNHAYDDMLAGRLIRGVLVHEH